MTAKKFPTPNLDAANRYKFVSTTGHARVSVESPDGEWWYIQGVDDEVQADIALAVEACVATNRDLAAKLDKANSDLAAVSVALELARVEAARVTVPTPVRKTLLMILDQDDRWIENGYCGKYPDFAREKNKESRKWLESLTVAPKDDPQETLKSWKVLANEQRKRELEAETKDAPTAFGELRGELRKPAEKRCHRCNGSGFRTEAETFGDANVPCPSCKPVEKRCGTCAHGVKEFPDQRYVRCECPVPFWIARNTMVADYVADCPCWKEKP